MHSNTKKFLQILQGDKMNENEYYLKKIAENLLSINIQLKNINKNLEDSFLKKIKP